jgi:2-aminoadipate transaminase
MGDSPPARQAAILLERSVKRHATESDLVDQAMYAARGLLYEGSPIDELRAFENASGDVISFSHGSPSPDALPSAIVQQLSDDFLHRAGADLLNYSDGAGDTLLREFIARWYTKDDGDLSRDNILITNGATQAFDLTLKLLVEPGDRVLVESPSYPNHLAALRNYGAQLIPVPLDECGLVVDQIPDILDQNQDCPPKLLYVQPTFQNPTGLTLSLERRQRLLSLARERHLLILEDDPYGELRFEGDPLPSLAELDDGSHVIAFGSFSKTVAPGLRVGWACAASDVIRRLLNAKMLSDICTPLWSQSIIAGMIQADFYRPEVERLIRLWRGRRDAMSAALRLEFTEEEEVTWTEPEGGWFTWLTLAPRIDTQALLGHAIREGVTFVPGIVFYPGGEASNSLRLCYTYAPEAEFQPGIHALRAALRKYSS